MDNAHISADESNSASALSCALMGGSVDARQHDAGVCIDEGQPRRASRQLKD